MSIESKALEFARKVQDLDWVDLEMQESLGDSLHEAAVEAGLLLTRPDEETALCRQAWKNCRCLENEVDEDTLCFIWHPGLRRVVSEDSK